MAQIGDLIGNYRLVEVLGSGTFGQVFRAENRYLPQHQRAIKFLHLEHLGDAQEREKFLREAKILNQLDHPSILQISDFCLDDNMSYIMTDYAAGGTLRKLLKERKGQPLELAEALRIVEPISETLQYAHDNGIVHSDLKPENILFDAQGRPLLADFGVAVELTTRSSNLGNGGTAPYMAPEQFDARARRESDQYALGCLLYEMLTGRRPFQGATIVVLLNQHLHEQPVPPRQLNPRIPEHVSAAILKAMAKEYKQRHASVSAFLEALKAPPQSSRPESPPQTVTPELSRRPPTDYQDEPDFATDRSVTTSPSGPMPASPPAIPADPISSLPPGVAQAAFPAGPKSELPPHPALSSRSGSNSIAFTPAPDTRLLTDPQQPAQREQQAQPAPQRPAARSTGKAPRSQTAQRTQKPPVGPALPNQPMDSQRSKIPGDLVLPGPLSIPRQPNVRQSPRVNGNSGQPRVAQSPVRTAVRVAPQSPPVAPQPSQRSRRRKLLLALILLSSLILVGVLLLNALGGPGVLASLGHLTASVKVTPQSQVVQNNYLISAVTTTPDAAQRQVGARVLRAQSETQHASANSTGSIPARQATGTLTFQNIGSTGLTIGSTTLTGADGVQIRFNGPVFVPATGSASVTVDAYAVNAGSAGNIKAFDISGNCCVPDIVVKNTAPFTGGVDAIANAVIQQSDIDGAIRPLVGQLAQSTLAALQQQMESGEHLVDGSANNCPATTSADHKAGDVAKTVTVSVSVKCSEEVFDLAGAQRMASGFLQNSPPNTVDLTGYKLVGSVVTTLTSATVVSGQNQVSVNIQAAGRWVFQFSDPLKQQIKQALVKRSKAEAQNILKQYMGISSATIDLSSGSVMPDKVNDIALKIVSIPGLQPGTPTSTPTVPAGTPPDTNTPGTKPNATSTPDLGGS